MSEIDNKDHWNRIYQSKPLKEVSWYEKVPVTSIDFLNETGLPFTSKIIDVGGGDSFFADSLLDLGYTDITVVDISEAALNRAKLRLGQRAEKIKWIVADASNFSPEEKYDFWHDRAAFHFLTQEQSIVNYLNTVKKSINPSGVLVIGTFSKQGPENCSGLEIKQYSEKTMTRTLHSHFEKIKCISIDHKTPFDTIQNFVFCSFRKTRAAYINHHNDKGKVE